MPVKLGLHPQKNEIRFMSFTLCKDECEVIKDLNLKPEMLKVLKENIGTIPQGPGVGKNYLNRTTTARNQPQAPTHRTTWKQVPAWQRQCQSSSHTAHRVGKTLVSWTSGEAPIQSLSRTAEMKHQGKKWQNDRWANESSRAVDRRNTHRNKNYLKRLTIPSHWRNEN